MSSASPIQGSVYPAFRQFCELFSFVSISTASDYLFQCSYGTLLCCNSYSIFQLCILNLCPVVYCEGLVQRLFVEADQLSVGLFN